MLRFAAALACLTGCLTISTMPVSSFSDAPPAVAALAFGRFTVENKPIHELRFGRFGDPFTGNGTNALIDAQGNFAVVLEPGAYYLDSYEPLGERTRIIGHNTPPDPVWHFEVRAGELHWLGAWYESAWSYKHVELQRVEKVQPRDVLNALSKRAAGTAWESALRGELARSSGEALSP